MNSKLLFVSLFIFTSCGVKAPPRADSSLDIPSVVQQYKSKLISNIEDESKESKKKKNKK